MFQYLHKWSHQFTLYWLRNSAAAGYFGGRPSSGGALHPGSKSVHSRKISEETRSWGSGGWRWCMVRFLNRQKLATCIEFPEDWLHHVSFLQVGEAIRPDQVKVRSSRTLLLVYLDLKKKKRDYMGSKFLIINMRAYCFLIHPKKACTIQLNSFREQFD